MEVGAAPVRAIHSLVGIEPFFTRKWRWYRVDVTFGDEVIEDSYEEENAKKHSNCFQEEANGFEKEAKQYQDFAGLISSGFGLLEYNNSNHGKVDCL